MICLIVFIICTISFVCFYRAFKKADIQFSKERKIFIAYLDNIKDFETLKHIGEINMFNVRERWYPRYTNVMPYLDKKIEETKDENYILYQIAYETFIKKYLITMPFIVLAIIIPIGYIVFLIRN